MFLPLILFPFIMANAVDAGYYSSNYESGYAVQINAYASSGYYYLEDGKTSNGDVVFSRRTSDPRYIYKLPSGVWHISKTIGATGSFAHCNKDDIRDCNADENDFYIEYYVKAYASSGVYFLTKQLSSGEKVYSRGTTDERYIYRWGNQWFIGRDVGKNSYFSTCSASNLADCDWLTLCVKAYGSNGVYKRTTEVYNNKEVYERISGGNKRSIYYNNKGYGWIIAQFTGGGYYTYCKGKENIRGCDSGIVVEQCSDSWSASDSLPQPIWFDYDGRTNIIISVLCTLGVLLLMYSVFKACVFFNNKQKSYKTVFLGEEEEEDEEEIKELNL